MLLVIMLPVLILFLLPGGSMAGARWFWLLAVLIVLLVWSMLGRPADDGLQPFAHPRPLAPGEQPDAVLRSMNVDEAVEVPSGVRIFRGTLKNDAENAFATLRQGVGP